MQSYRQRQPRPSQRRQNARNLVFGRAQIAQRQDRIHALFGKHGGRFCGLRSVAVEIGDRPQLQASVTPQHSL